MPTILIKRGTGTTALAQGELGFKTTDYGLYIGTSNDGNVNVGRPVKIVSQSEYDTEMSNTAIPKELKDKIIYFIKNTDGLVTQSTVDSSFSTLNNSVSSIIDTINSHATSLTSLSNSKQNKITGGLSTVLTSNLTKNRALVTNSSGKIKVSAVTSTELGYLDGVTSKIQTQLDSKMATGTSFAVDGGGTGATTASAARTNLGLKYTQLWSGTFSSGSISFSASGYDLLLIAGRPASGAGTEGFYIPIGDLTSSNTKWQIADETTYFNFQVKISSGTVTITYGASNGSGRLYKVYGTKIGA